MANNCRITALKFTLKKGSSISSGTIPTSAFLTILPKPGYTVSASKFTHGTLPTNVDTCVFADTGTAGELYNTVKATVTFSSGFVFNSNTKFKIDINGSADLYKPEEKNIDVRITIQDLINPNLDSSPIVTFTAATSAFTVSQEEIAPETEPGHVEKTTTKISGVAVKNTSTKIATLKVESKTGYYINSLPYLKYINIRDGIIKLKRTSSTRDSNNRATIYNFDIMFSNKTNSYYNSNSIILLKYNTALIKNVPKEIRDIRFGTAIIDESGANKKIIINATEDAEFDVTVTKRTDGKSILNSSVVNTTILDPVVGSLDAVSYKVSSLRNGKFKRRKLVINQRFPKYSSTILSTAINMGGGLSGTTATFDSLTGVKVGDRLMMDEIDTSTEITVTQINSSVECVLSTSVTAGNNATAKFIRKEKYDINVYPKNDTVLGGFIPSTYPQYTIEQIENPVLKLTTSTSNPRLTAAAAITYTGRANSFPGSLKNVRSIPKSFSIDYSFTNSAGGSVTKVSDDPTWSSTEALDVSSATSSDWTNSVHADAVDSSGNEIKGNGGTHIEMFNIVTTYGATATLKADIIIKKWGNKDVTMNLDLDTIFAAIA